MKFEDGQVKPCSTCFKTRQLAISAAGKLMRRTVAPHSLVELTDGDITIQNSDHTISAVTVEAWNGLIGRRIYLAGRQVIDVKAAKPLAMLGNIVKVSPID